MVKVIQYLRDQGLNWSSMTMYFGSPSSFGCSQIATPPHDNQQITLTCQWLTNFSPRNPYILSDQI